MSLRYLSLCSGIEAASVAWHPLGWQPFAFAEIEKFPSAVLAHRFPHVPNLGDMTKFKDWPDATVDVLVGGTPCQSFSVAGLRAGLADPRGNLCLTYLAIADRYRPRWLLWENVPGVLSSGGGRDFGAFLGGLGQLGYGFAYRVLDAQYVRVDGFGRAVPQRRRRVFVVGYLGDWRRAAAVLFDAASLYGDSAPRREAGKGTAEAAAYGISPDCFDRSGEPTSGLAADRNGLGVDRELAYALRAKRPGGVAHPLAYGGNNQAGPIEVATAVNAHGGPAGRLDFESETFIATPTIAQTLTRGAESAGKGGYAGRRQEDDANLVAFAIQAGATRENPDSGPDGVGVQAEHAYTLEARAEVQAVAFDMRGREGGSQFEGPHLTANIRAASGGSSRSYVAQQWAVRRLMPIECERLQGFPDNWTLIPTGARRRLEADELSRLRSLANEQLASIFGVDPETFSGCSDEELARLAADGPRYKALGNSMAVNAMRWIGQRIALVEATA